MSIIVLATRFFRRPVANDSILDLTVDWPPVAERGRPRRSDAQSLQDERNRSSVDRLLSAGTTKHDNPMETDLGKVDLQLLGRCDVPHCDHYLMPGETLIDRMLCLRKTYGRMLTNQPYRLNLVPPGRPSHESNLRLFITISVPACAVGADRLGNWPVIADGGGLAISSTDK